MLNLECRRRSRWAMGTVVSVLYLVCISSSLIAETPVDFSRDIRSILSDRCFSCHGPDEQAREADLRFDVEASAKDSVIVGGNAAESEMMRRILSDDDAERMPPPEMGKPITEDEIALIRRWIDEGAEWSAHWAYIQPRQHTIPAAPTTGPDSAWPRNWIDHFILQRITQARLHPSPKADSTSLVRRLCFDLTGLPPSIEQVEQFRGIDSESEYTQFVDSLLESPAFGERMAMYWLDLVRFADTVGYHGDQDHNITPYRDYVIRAFNENLPFDQFTREQLAGDLIPNGTFDQKIATGYNRLLQTSHEGGVQAKEYLAIYAADRVRNVSNVWMGATVGCAQCHDHKYDPYTAKDFYAMSAFFADIDDASHLKNGTNELPTRREPEVSVLSPSLEATIRAFEQQLTAVNGDGNLTTEQRKAKAEGIAEQLKSARRAGRKSMITVALKSPRTTRLLPRGDWLDESGPVVESAVPEFLGTLDVEGRATRLDLANWLTDIEHGDGLKTARVFANRFWYLLFGKGLARTLDDFGGQGQPPVHPELLDNLAMEFAANGWDIKHIMRLIVTSATYRQSSARDAALRSSDPDNRLLASQSSYRLPAEMIRDNALAISGLLVNEVGGESVKPYQPAGYYQHLNFPTRKYQAHDDDRQWRRGVYVHWQRQYLHPMLKAFDAPSREECTAERPRSNTPLAALTLLNDPSFVEAARVFAESIVAEGGESDAERLAFAYRQAVSRKPSLQETAVLEHLLNSQRQHYSGNAESARQLLELGLAKSGSKSDSRQAIELASWTFVARALLNLDETITRN